MHISLGKQTGKCIYCDPVVSQNRIRKENIGFFVERMNERSKNILNNRKSLLLRLKIL